jgi:hypothetical protein
MYRLLVSVAVFMLATAVAVNAQTKEKSPGEQFKALIGEIQQGQQKAVKGLESAKTDKEKQQIVAEFDKFKQSVAAKLVDLARKNPTDKISFDALAVVVSNAGDTPQAGAAVDALLDKHLQDRQLPFLMEMAAEQNLPVAEKLLKGVEEKSKDHKLQGSAALGLAQLAKARTEAPNLKPQEAEKLAKKAQELYQQAAKKYGDVAEIKEAVKRDLFDLEHLAIGKEAPDISGDDADGKGFKLADYRGKIVVLDFWADT